jgi:hypothetical protein
VAHVSGYPVKRGDENDVEAVLPRIRQKLL